MKKSNHSNKQEKGPYVRKIEEENKKRNFAKERVKRRLKSLRKKIFSLEKRAQTNKKMRMEPIQKLITEYNQTLELLYGKGAAVLPNLRLRSRKVEVFVPSIDAGTGGLAKGRGGLQKSSDQMPAPDVIYANDSLLEPRGFDSFRTIDELEREIEIIEEINDRLENPDDHITFSIEPDKSVKPGQVLFVVRDIYGKVEFAVTLSLSESVDGKVKSYVPFVKDLAVSLFENGFECTFFVNPTDLDQGLITPHTFDDDSDPFYDGGTDFDDPPTFSFS